MKIARLMTCFPFLFIFLVIGCSDTKHPLTSSPGKAILMSAERNSLAESTAVADNVVEIYAPASSADQCIPGVGQACPGGYGSGVVFERNDIVLTAGHVVSRRDSQGHVVNELPPGEQVWFHGTAYPISQVIYQPNYFQGADLALVKLASPIPTTPAQPSTEDLSAGMLVSTAGYGQNKFDTSDPNEGGGAFLHTGQLTFKNYQAIDSQNPGDNLNQLFPNAYLIFGPGPRGTVGCDGDSGSPALDSQGNVVGVLIWYFYPNGSSASCADVTADNYISLVAFESWISSSIAVLDPPPPIRYAAIAYSFSSGAWASGWNYSDEKGAETAAITTCAHSDCQVVQTAQNACIALARGPNYTAWSNPVSTRTLAQAAALGTCNAQSSQCTLVTSVCANGGTSD